MHPTRIFKKPEDLEKAWRAYKKDLIKNELGYRNIGINGFYDYCIINLGNVKHYFSNNNYYSDFRNSKEYIKEDLFNIKLKLYKLGLIGNAQLISEASLRGVNLGSAGVNLGSSNINQFVVEDDVISISDHLLKRKHHSAKRLISNKHPDTIYVLNIEGTNIYKIGTSQNTQRRIKDIQSYNPFLIDIILIIKTKGAYELEQFIHDLIEDKHIKNEWFKIQDIDSVLKKMKQWERKNT
jgi:hypothetical protein